MAECIFQQSCYVLWVRDLIQSSLVVGGDPGNGRVLCLMSVMGWMLGDVK